MASSRFPIGARARGQRQTAQQAVVPAFVGGVNAQRSVRTMQPDEMLYAYNIVPSEYGLRTRKGTVEHTRGVTTNARTLIPFHGLNPNQSDDRLFAVTTDGIWDVSSAGTATASNKFPWTDDPDAGYGVYDTFQNDAGALFILYADSKYGLHIYTASTDTWAAATGITGVDVTTIRSIANHKQRIWLITENSPDAYYLPLVSIAGAAQKFVFGANAPAGGDLVGLYNWTRDGGDGVDDHLVAVHRGGDVTGYKGSDPGLAATWETTGRWNIGGVPAGRRIATTYGGEVYVLSTYGIISMSSLFRGAEFTDFQEQETGKITRIIRERMATEFQDLGWEMAYHPQEGELLINSPSNTTRPVQYVLNLVVKGWGIWRDLEMNTFAPWRNRLMSLGKKDGRVWTYGDTADNILLDDTDGSQAKLIQFSLLSSYQDMGQPGSWKIMDFGRPTYVTQDFFSSRVLFVPDYKLEELNFAPLPPDEDTPGGVWDTSVWDGAVWSGISFPQREVEGSLGMGLVFAIALQGEVRRRASLISIGCTWRHGAFL